MIGINPYVEHPNIEDFGFPAWDLIDPRKYFNQDNEKDKPANVHFSRGCPFSCRFCVKLGTKLRFRSIEHIWKELEYLNKTFGVKRFKINDEGYSMSPKFVKEFCRYTIAKGNPFSYFTSMGLRLNRVDDEMLELMKEARHERVFGVGIESAVPRVRQELMNKCLTQEDIERGLKLLNKHGFEPIGNFILGFPGETREELIQSVNWAYDALKRGCIHGANLIPFLPLPGSEATKKLLEDGELPQDYDHTKLNLTVVSYAPKGMTIGELDGLRRWAVWKLNFNSKMIWRYISDKGRFLRAMISFTRIFIPNWILCRDWRRK